MARIVCQVLHRGDRVTFLWSEGHASFEPYHLEGNERANLLDLAAQIHEKFADGPALAQLGQRLYRAVFRLDAVDPGAAARVQPWVSECVRDNKIDQLEFLSDAPGLIPWTMLCEEASGAGDPWPRFWGTRFQIGTGRRVNILRQNPLQVNPVQMTAADLDLVEQLSDAQRALLNPLREAGKLVHLASSLADELQKATPDIVMLFVRCEQGRLRLGADSFDIDTLQTWLTTPREGNPDPIVILMGSGPRAEQAAWQTLLGAASAAFSGLIANETLLPAPQAFAVGQALTRRFSEGLNTLGEILFSLRQEQGAAALAFSAFCPLDMRVVKEGMAPAPAAGLLALPSKPYRPFAAFEAADRPLFLGREEDTLRGALLADQATTRGILLHGSPAVGKTSYLQAGLLPFLEEESVGFSVLRDRTPLEGPVAENDYPPLILRTTSDLAGQFADALCVFCAQAYTFTTPAGTQATVDLPSILHAALGSNAPLPSSARGSSTAIQAPDGAAAITANPPDPNDELSPQDLWVALRDNPGLLATILDAITWALPFELIIAVDQGEELLTLVRSAKEQERRQKALAMLAALGRTPARCKIIFTLRTQALGQLVSFFPGEQTPADWRSFYLRPLNEAELVDALVCPTSREELPASDEIPHAKYGFAFEAGMAQQIVSEAIDAAADDQQSPLPVIQAVGALLYRKLVLGKNQTTLHIGDAKDFGGVKAALLKYLEDSLDRLKLLKASRTALRRLIGKLYTSHTDGTLSRDLVAADDLKTLWSGAPEPVEPIVNKAADEEGLFEIQQLMIAGQSDVYVSLPQDSLARVGAKIDGEVELQAFGRTKIIDTLWIMIPLAFLCAAITFFVTRNYLNSSPAEELKQARDKILEEADKFIKSQAKHTYADKYRRPLYYGQIARAEQSLRAGNLLRARQILLEHPAMRSFNEELDQDFKLPDLRGFEWDYLWRRLHSERYLFEGHTSVIDQVAMSPDGKRAASSSHDGTIRIWNLAKGEPLALVKVAKTPEPIAGLAFSPDGKTLASSGPNHHVYLWDISKLTDAFTDNLPAPKKLSGHTGAVLALAFGKDAHLLASAGADHSVLIWDLAKEPQQKFTLKDHKAKVVSLAFAADGKRLVSVDGAGALIVWDANEGKKEMEIATRQESVARVDISADGKTAYTAGAELDKKTGVPIGTLRFWDLAAGTESRPTIQHGTNVTSLALHPNGNAIATGGQDQAIRLWDIKTGAELHHWLGHYGAITCLAFTKDSTALVSGSFDAKVKVWNPAQSSGPDVIAAHDDWVQCLALNTKNNLLASGSRDGSVKLWNPADGKLIAKIADLKGAVTALAFSRHNDKPLLAAASRDDKNKGEIKIWQIDDDPKTGFKAVEKHVLDKHDKGVTCLAFSPAEDNANLLVSGSADHTVKLWEALTGKEKETYKGHKDEVRCVVFAADGNSFASGGRDMRVCISEPGSKEIWTMADVSLNSIETLAPMQIEIFAEEMHGFVPAVLVGNADHTVSIWPYDKGQPGKLQTKNLLNDHLHSGPVSGVLIHAAKERIVSCSWDGTIKVADFRETQVLVGERLQRAFVLHETLTLTGHQGAVRAVAMAADLSFLASAGNDGTIHLWRAAPRIVPKREVK